MPFQKNSGYNLIELLMALAVGTIVTALAVPSFAHFQLQNQRSSSVQQLHNLLLYTRAKAASTRSTTTLCLSDDASSCNREANNFLLVFIDHDDDKQVDQGELLRQEQPVIPGTRYRLRASNRHTIRYTPTGRVKDFGHFIICPQNGDPKFATRLVIHPSGRPRHGRDNDGDGIVEDNQGNPMDCTGI